MFERSFFFPKHLCDRTGESGNDMRKSSPLKERKEEKKGNYFSNIAYYI